MLDLEPETIAFASAGVHVLGYAVYIAFVRRGQIDANPLSWLMFAYGTGLLTFLEYRSGAAWTELLLPIACSVSSVAVAALSLRTTRMQKVEFPDIAAFCVDVLLTLAYVGVWAASRNGLDHAYAELAVIGFLVCANLTTVTAFAPLLRSTFACPSNERILPWMLWTTAYLLLLIVTLRDTTSFERLSLLLYPALNAALHFGVMVLAMSRWWRAPQVVFEVKKTAATGLGLFTPKRFRRGERVFVLTGAVRQFRSRSIDDACQKENWFGIGEDRWIDPDAPYMYLNHSCSPNLGIRGERDYIALRDIAPGDELTIDYSLTEVDPYWRMECTCGEPHCRRVIGPIQTLPYDIFLSYLPFISGCFRRAYLRAMRKVTPKFSET